VAQNQALEFRKLTSIVGAEVIGADVGRFRDDPDLPRTVADAVEEHGVLLFRGLNIDDETQIAFSRKLGPLRTFADNPVPEIFDVGWNDSNRYSEYLRGNVSWHFDGVLDQDIQTKIGMLSAKVVTTEGGETYFASSYAAYEMLSDEEKEKFKELQVLFSYEASQRRVFVNPSEEQVAAWRKWPTPPRVHPLVWTHASGRKSLTISSTMDHIVDWEIEEGRALLNNLVRRATAPDRVYRHVWGVGDSVIWDNSGLYHRVNPYDPHAGRSLHRTTVLGKERIQ